MSSSLLDRCSISLLPKGFLQSAPKPPTAPTTIRSSRFPPCGAFQPSSGIESRRNGGAYACAHADDDLDVLGARGGRGVSWDPEGILPPPSLGGHFARRERRGRSTTQEVGRDSGADNVPADLEAANDKSKASVTAVAALLGDGRDVHPIPPEWAAAGGAPISLQGAISTGEFATLLATRHMAVDLAFPGLCVQSVDPPVLTVDGFLSPDECREIIDAAQHSGGMEASKVGAGNVGSETSARNARRTSSSMLLSPATLATQPRLRASAEALQRAIWRLLLAGEGEGWGRAGRMPAPNQFCFESLQVAEYQRGQHFLEHEDAFPVEIACENGFQRHATVLVYLNDVAERGRTVFNQLGVSVKPEVGKALIFFPAFADSTPDARTLHTAEAAVDTKWVTQQWIACGVSQHTSLPPLVDRLQALRILGGRGDGGFSEMSGPAQLADGDARSVTDMASLRSKVRELKKSKKTASKNSGRRGFGSRD